MPQIRLEGGTLDSRPVGMIAKCTNCSADLQIPILVESIETSNIPRSDRPERFRCRAPRGSSQSCCRNSHFLSAASETSRLAPSDLRLGHPTVRRTQERPRRMFIQLVTEMHSTLHHGCTHLLAGRMCGTVHELTSFLPRRSHSS